MSGHMILSVIIIFANSELQYHYLHLLGLNGVKNFPCSLNLGYTLETFKEILPYTNGVNKEGFIQRKRKKRTERMKQGN